MVESRSARSRRLLHSRLLPAVAPARVGPLAVPGSSGVGMGFRHSIPAFIDLSCCGVSSCPTACQPLGIGNLWAVASRLVAVEPLAGGPNRREGVRATDAWQTTRPAAAAPRRFSQQRTSPDAASDACRKSTAPSSGRAPARSGPRPSATEAGQANFNSRFVKDGRFWHAHPAATAGASNDQRASLPQHR